MRGGFIYACVLSCGAWGQDFTGTWLLREADSRITDLPSAPAARLTIAQAAGKYTCAACGAGGWAFTVDRKSTETRGAGVRNSAAAKWEGEGLVVSVLVLPASGPQYSITDHWRLDRNGARLTITREYQRTTSAESTLVYLREGAVDLPVAEPAPPPPRIIEQPASPPAAPEPAGEYVLETGARLPLRSLSAFSSRTAKDGDRVYLETAQPVTRFGKLLLPAGTQITATVAFAQGAGRVKGRGELLLRFESLTTPEGVTKDFRGQTSGADATAGRVDREGAIRSGGNKGGDAGTVGTTTAAGAVIGAGAGHAGLGAAAGAAAGLARVLGTRGPEVSIRRGDVVEMSLDREIRFAAKEVR